MILLHLFAILHDEEKLTFRKAIEQTAEEKHQSKFTRSCLVMGIRGEHHAIGINRQSKHDLITD